MSTRKKPVAVAVLPAPIEAAPEAVPTPIAAPTSVPDLKPFVVDVDSLTLGDLEFMESLSQMEIEGKRPSTSQIFELFTRFFEGWTVEDCRKIRISQVENVKEQLFASIARAVPNGSGTAS